MKYAFLWCQPNLPSVHNVERRWLTPCPEPRLDVECPEVNLCPRGFLSMSAQPGHREKPRAVFVFSWTFLVMLGCLFPLQKKLPVAVVAQETGVLTAFRCDYSLLVQGDVTSKGPASAGCLGSRRDLGSSSLPCLSLEKGKTELLFHFPLPLPLCPLLPWEDGGRGDPSRSI